MYFWKEKLADWISYYSWSVNQLNTEDIWYQYNFIIYCCPCLQLAQLNRYEDVLSKLNAEAIKRSQTQIAPTTDIMEVCPSPLRLAEQLTHIELVRLYTLALQDFTHSITVSPAIILCEQDSRDFIRRTITKQHRSKSTVLVYCMYHTCTHHRGNTIDIMVQKMP